MNLLYRKISNNELLSGSIINFSIKILSFFLNYLIMYIMINSYGIEDYGKYNLYLTVTSLLSILIVFGTDTFFLKEIAIYQSLQNRKKIFFSISKVILINAILVSVITFILFYSSDLVKNYLVNNNLSLNIILSISICTAASLVLVNGIRGTKKIFIYSISQMFILRFVITVLLLSGIVFGMLMEHLLNTSFIISVLIVGYFFYKFVFKDKESLMKKEVFSFDSSILKIYKNTSNIFISSVFLILITKLDVLFLSFYYDLEKVGIYSSALQITMLVNFAMSSINGILSPLISKFYFEKSIEKLSKTIKQANTIILITAFISGAALIIFIQPITQAIGIDVTQDFYIVILILILGQIISSIMGSIINLLNMSGHYRSVLYSIGFALIITFLLSYFLVPRFGIIGASIGISVGLISKDLIATYFGLRIFNFKFNLFDFRKQ